MKCKVCKAEIGESGICENCLFDNNIKNPAENGIPLKVSKKVKGDKGK